MHFIDSDLEFPISSALVHSGRVFEAVMTGMRVEAAFTAELP